MQSLPLKFVDSSICIGAGVFSQIEIGTPTQPGDSKNIKTTSVIRLPVKWLVPISSEEIVVTIVDLTSNKVFPV